MGFSRQEYWSGLPFPSPGDLPDPGIEPKPPALQADALTSEPQTLLRNLINPKGINTSLLSLEQQSADFFYKGPDSKQFKCGGPQGVCHNGSLCSCLLKAVTETNKHHCLHEMFHLDTNLIA